MGVRWYIGLSALALLVSCSKEEDILPNQQQRIVSFLTGSHSPRLLSEADAAVSLDNDPPYYSTFGNTTYRYIADVYDAERLSRPEVTAGCRIDVTFSLYDFSEYRSLTTETCVYSNDTVMINRLVADGLNPTHWVQCDDSGVPLLDGNGQFVPYACEIEMGGSGVLKGLRAAFVGCREQDEVEFYMTYNEAYGEKLIVGLMPKQSPVAMVCTINKVTK